MCYRRGTTMVQKDGKQKTLNELGLLCRIVEPQFESSWQLSYSRILRDLRIANKHTARSTSTCMCITLTPYLTLISFFLSLATWLVTADPQFILAYFQILLLTCETPRSASADKHGLPSLSAIDKLLKNLVPPFSYHLVTQFKICDTASPSPCPLPSRMAPRLAQQNVRSALRSTDKSTRCME